MSTAKTIYKTYLAEGRIDKKKKRLKKGYAKQLSREATQQKNALPNGLEKLDSAVNLQTVQEEKEKGTFQMKGVVKDAPADHLIC